MKSMWKANKKGITTLLMGLVVLGGIHYTVSPVNEQLADQILALGFCALLFLVALVSWIAVKAPVSNDGWKSGWEHDGDVDHFRDHNSD